MYNRIDYKYLMSHHNNNEAAQNSQISILRNICVKGFTSSRHYISKRLSNDNCLTHNTCFPNNQQLLFYEKSIVSPFQPSQIKPADQNKGESVLSLMVSYITGSYLSPLLFSFTSVNGFSFHLIPNLIKKLNFIITSYYIF